jgi:hypothetical protein
MKLTVAYLITQAAVILFLVATDTVNIVLGLAFFIASYYAFYLFCKHVLGFYRDK